MKSKEFDQLVRQSFENASLPYRPENWQKLSAALDTKERSRKRLFLIPLASIAASVAMAIGIATWYHHEQNNDLQAQKHNARNTTHIANKGTETQNNAPRIVPPALPAVQPVNTRQSIVVPQQLPVVAQKPAPLQQQPQQVTPSVPEAPIVVQAVKDPQPVAFKEETPLVAVNDNAPRPLAALTNANSYYENVAPPKKEKKKYITMAGGLNYGTLSSGYVMGFSAGKKMGDRFYVESDVAFVGNIANQKNQGTTFTAKKNPYSKSTSYNASTITVQRYYNLYYAQLTPTLGYRVGHNLSVGLGADMQKLLINQQLITETDDPAKSKELPGLDMGLVGKGEYNLTREIKASVYYRKAMNQSLTGNNKLLDRDYLQLQLKFMIFNR